MAFTLASRSLPLYFLPAPQLRSPSIDRYKNQEGAWPRM